MIDGTMNNEEEMTRNNLGAQVSAIKVKCAKEQQQSNRISGKTFFLFLLKFLFMMKKKKRETCTVSACIDMTKK